MIARKQLGKFGTHGRSVRVFVERGGILVRCEWREHSQRRTESWPNTPANRKVALVYGEETALRIARRVGTAPSPITIGEMFDRYVRIQSDHWRFNTRRLAIERWRKFQEFAGPAMPAHHVSPALIDDFRVAMRPKHAVNQVIEHVKVVKAVFRWARKGKLLEENPLAEYEMRLSKEEKRAETHEYTPEECALILAHTDGHTRLGWRLHVALILAATLGPRETALRWLEWRDINFGARTVQWRSERDKVGKDRTQPLPRDAVRVLRLARVWRHREKYTGPFVLPPSQERTRAKCQPWTYQALQQGLHKAAAAAGVRRVQYKALHAFRRMVLTSVEEMTGSIVEAGLWIGDTDIKSIQKYRKRREIKQRDVAGRIGDPRHQPTTQTAPAEEGREEVTQ